MMKCAFVVILSLVCSSLQLNRNLNNEIIEGLRNLSPMVRLPKNCSVPGQYMKKHPSHCLGNFTFELREILNNVTHDNRTEDLLEKLDANLKSLGMNQTNNSNCTMEMSKKKSSFNNYIFFLQKLNSGK